MRNQCLDCGFVYDLSQSGTVERDIRERVADVVTILRDTEANLRSRRQPGVWSPLEYGCHLRDMLLVQRERVLAARRMDRPDCPPSGRDERVIHDGYADQQPEDVARQLADAAQLFTMSSPDWPPTTGSARSSTTSRKPMNGRCGGSRYTRCMRHNTTYSTFAARSDRKSATEYDGFEYAALPVACCIFAIALCRTMFVPRKLRASGHVVYCAIAQQYSIRRNPIPARYR